MSAASQSLTRAETQPAKLLTILGVLSLILLSSLLTVLGVSLLVPALVAVVAGFLWLAFRHPIFCLGLILALIPLDPLALLLARFFGPSFMASDMVKAFDRIILLVPIFVLWLRNGIRLAKPDWLLLACFALAVLRLAFGGSLVALIYDFDFIIAYAAGRVAVLSARQQECWAKRAVWIVAVLSLLGMVEVFILGEGPRTVLYLAAEDSATEHGALIGSYHVQGFSGLRESSTMFGPLQFGALCMVALIVWWVYSKAVLPGGIIACGMILTLSRSAWIGAAVAIFVLGALMRQKSRLLLPAFLAGALLLGVSIVVGLGDFLSATVKGEEVSAEGHKESLVQGVAYVLSHPFGIGPGNAGTLAFKNDTYVVWTENSYLTLASGYGIATALCFVAFLVSVAATILPQEGRLAYAAFGILVGFSTVMMFLAGIYDVFSLAAWIWFPVGLAVRASTVPAEKLGALS